IAGPVAIWGPSGTHFSQPAHMTLPYQLQGDQLASQLSIAVQEHGATATSRIAHKLVAVDEPAKRVSFDVQGFTSFQPTTERCASAADCGSGEQCVSGACV